MALCSKTVALSQYTILINMYEFIPDDILWGEILITPTTIRSFVQTESRTDFSTPVLMSEQRSVVEGKSDREGMQSLPVRKFVL